MTPSKAALESQLAELEAVFAAEHEAVGTDLWLRQIEDAADWSAIYDLGADAGFAGVVMPSLVRTAWKVIQDDLKSDPRKIVRIGPRDVKWLETWECYASLTRVKDTTEGLTEYQVKQLRAARVRIFGARRTPGRPRKPI